MDDEKNKEKKGKRKKKKQEGRLKSRLMTLALCLIMLAGFCIMAYPAVSNWWNSFHQTQALTDYDDVVQSIEDYNTYFEAADAYNKKLSSLENPFSQYKEIQDEYMDALNVMGTGMIGYVSIEKLGVRLPIYHGTSEDVLNVAAGHLEGTSLPVGGKGTHAAISSHRGLPTAKLFTSLDELEEGDTFTVTVLNRTITYEVDQIVVVLPTETDELKAVKGKDYCTLITCTPYGINTHRLLVRGHRTQNAKQDAVIRPEAEKISYKKSSVFTMAALLVILFIITMVKKTKRKKEITLEQVKELVRKMDASQYEETQKQQCNRKKNIKK